MSVALTSFNVITIADFFILMAIFRNFTNKLFIIGKKSCLGHLAARSRYFLRQYGTINSLRLTKKMVYLPLWHRAGIKQISDLFDENENCVLPFLFLRNKYTLTCNFLRYHGLISAISQSWKKLLQTNSGDSITPPLQICTVTCKMLYDKLLTLENLPPPTSEKKTLIVRYHKGEFM